MSTQRFISIYTVLALTACLSNADNGKLGGGLKDRFKGLKKLQTELVENMYESDHGHMDEYHHQPVEHNPYMDEYQNPYYEDHHFEPEPHHQFVEHNPYTDGFHPIYEGEHHQETPFAYEAFAEYHEPVLPYSEHHEPIVPIFEDPYHHDFTEGHVPVYEQPHHFEPEHEYHDTYHTYEHDDWHVEQAPIVKPAIHGQPEKKASAPVASTPKKDGVISSMPELDDQHIFSQHQLLCPEGEVHIGNRCMKAQALVGDDHQGGGHHFRKESGDYHLRYNDGGEDDPYAEESPEEVEEGDDDEEYDDEQDPEEADQEEQDQPEKTTEEKPQQEEQQEEPQTAGDSGRTPTSDRKADLEKKKKIQEDLEKYAQTHAGDYEKPHLTTSPEQVTSKDQPEKPATETEAKPAEPVEEPKKIKDDPCPQGFAFTVNKQGAEACRMPFSYHSGHGHVEQCANCVYSYGRWFEACEENFIRNGCCLCTPQCPDGMPMVVWPEKELNDYVCLIPAHKHDDSSFKEISAEKQKPEPTPTKEPVAPAPKKEKKEVKGLDLEPKTPEKVKQADTPSTPGSTGEDLKEASKPEVAAPEEKKEEKPYTQLEKILLLQ